MCVVDIALFIFRYEDWVRRGISIGSICGMLVVSLVRTKELFRDSFPCLVWTYLLLWKLLAYSVRGHLINEYSHS